MLYITEKNTNGIEGISEELIDNELRDAQLIRERTQQECISIVLSSIHYNPEILYHLRWYEGHDMWFIDILEEVK